MSTTEPKGTFSGERLTESGGPPHGPFQGTSADVRARLVEGYRAMSPAEKVGRVVALNRAVEALAVAGIRSRHGDGIQPRELRFRLASLRLPRATMVRVFDWDPARPGS